MAAIQPQNFYQNPLLRRTHSKTISYLKNYIEQSRLKSMKQNIHACLKSLNIACFSLKIEIKNPKKNKRPKSQLGETYETGKLSSIFQIQVKMLRHIGSK